MTIHYGEDADSPGPNHDEVTWEADQADKLHEAAEIPLQIVSIPVSGEYVSLYSLVRWMAAEDKELEAATSDARQHAPTWFTHTRKSQEHAEGVAAISGRRTQLNRLAEFLNPEST